AVISILGYDPFRYYTGRGPLEIYGAGLKMEEGNLAIRCNFATASEDGTIIDRRVGRNLTSEEASQLAQALNDKIKLSSSPAEFIFKSTVAHRAVLLIKRLNGKLSGKITNTDPAYEKVEGIGVAKKEGGLKLERCRAMVNSEEAKVAANLVNEFTEKSQIILRKHETNFKRVAEGKPPANIILMRDAGDALPKFPSLESLYNISFGCMVEMPVERGIALLCGMKELPLPQSTGNMEKDYAVRAEKTEEALKRLDAIYIHIKGPDEPGHDGQCL
ncbi:MAG: phosphoglycerate mutase, partial [Candidatus Bathyarchaeia archaeon]